MTSDQSGNETRPAEFLLKSGSITATVQSVGATIVAINVADKADVTANVVRPGQPYAGAICGRFANRIANSTFALGGSRFQLLANEGANHLHGGPDGFDSRNWTTVSSDEQSVTLHLVSPDQDQGYPGRLEATVKYWLEPDGVFGTEVWATADTETVVNLASHPYWNLGYSQDLADDHHLDVEATGFLEVDDELIPTGQVATLESTTLDMTKPYDTCFVLKAEEPADASPALKRAAMLHHEQSGRQLVIETTQPALQVYTADHAGRFGIALETQGFPDAPNHPHFPSATLASGETYWHKTLYRFSCR